MNPEYIKIVADSSSNVLSMGDSNYTTVPLKIIAEKEYVDDAALNLLGMMEDLRNHKGKSGSSCPNVQEWLDAFEGADYAFGVTISKNLSGSYNAAVQACAEYMEEHPDRKAYVFDSLSAGPELAMIADKIHALAEAGKSFEEIEREFDGKGYGDFKLAVGETVVSVLKPLQDRMADIAKDKAYVDNVIKTNAEKANYFANKTLRKVQKKVGFPERIR